MQFGETMTDKLEERANYSIKVNNVHQLGRRKGRDSNIAHQHYDELVRLITDLSKHNKALSTKVREQQELMQDLIKLHERMPFSTSCESFLDDFSEYKALKPLQDKETSNVT